MECGNDKPGFVPSRLERNLTELLANYNCTQHPDLAGHHFSLTHINSGLDYSSRLLAGLSARMSFPTPVHFIPCCQIDLEESSGNDQMAEHGIWEERHQKYSEKRTED